MVDDNGDRTASPRDYVSIKLFGGPNTGDANPETADPSAIYSRDGYLTSGNIQVDNP